VSGPPLQKILILRFSSLGDIIMTTAMIRAVRKAFPTAKIDMVVRADFLDLIRNNPHLDEKIALGRGEGIRGLFELVKRINRERYDLIYDAHRSLRTRLIMPFLRAGRKRYFNKHYLRRALQLTFKLRLMTSVRFLEKFIEPLDDLGVCYDGEGPEMFLDDETRSRALTKVPLPWNDRTTLGIIPSAQWPGKRWPLAYFRQVIKALAENSSLRLIVMGGPEDTFCEFLCRDLPRERVINAQGKLSIGETAALIERCDLVLANDTGLMHVADALDVPQVLILGPTSAELGCLPFHPRSQILEESLWCRPCSKNGQAPCIRGRRYCLERILPDRVLTAISRVLGEGGR
jgi:lipopolysaccharide heptosyltransferase II